MTNNLTSKEKLNIFKDLFRGRDDVFAIRWQSADGLRSGYMPVCQNEWKQGLCLKLNREKCRNCTNKKYSPISDLNFIEHLTGQKLYGIYPLLQDNNSYFIAVDFDKKNWLDDTRNFVEVCNKYKLPVYVERSRSGNGSHIWIFFEDKYPAAKSRKIILKLLKEIELILGGPHCLYNEMAILRW